MSNGARIVLIILFCVLGAPFPIPAQTSDRPPFLMTRLPSVEDVPGGVPIIRGEVFPGRMPPGAAAEPQSQVWQLPTPDDVWSSPVATEGIADEMDAPAVGIQQPGAAERGAGEQGAAVDESSVESLQDAWRLALSVDQRRRAGVASIDAAQSQLDAAAAQQHPIAGLSGQYTMRDNEPAYNISTPVLPIRFNSPYMQSEDFSFEGRVDVPLYTGGRVTNRIAAAESQVQVTEYDLARYQLDLKMRVADGYVAVLRAEQDLSLAESHERSLAAHTRDTELFHEQGRAPRNDLLTAQVALSNARHRVIQTRSNVDAARASYNRLLGRPLTSAVKLARLHVGTTFYDVDRLTIDALARRPELSQFDAQIAAHRYEAETVLAENRAQVHLQGAYMYRENRYQSPEGITSAGIGVWWNLFDAGRARSTAESESNQARALAHRKADFQSQIQLEVRRAWLAVEETRQRLAMTSHAIMRAEENLRVTRQRYASGMATNSDVLTAETLRVETYRNHNNSVYDGVLADLRLHRATASL